MKRDTSPSILALLTQHGGTTRLADIPWEDLPAALRQTCEQFLQQWWRTFDLDQPIAASGLFDLTLAELLIHHGHRQRAHTAGYQLVSFLRIDPEDGEPLTYTEALVEKEQQVLMSPENVYRIEKIGETASCTSPSK